MRFAWMGYDWNMCWNLNIHVLRTNQVQMRQSAIGRWVADGIRSLVNARVLHESLLVPALMI